MRQTRKASRAGRRQTRRDVVGSDREGSRSGHEGHLPTEIMLRMPRVVKLAPWSFDGVAVASLTLTVGLSGEWLKDEH